MGQHEGGSADAIVNESRACANCAQYFVRREEGVVEASEANMMRKTAIDVDGRVDVRAERLAAGESRHRNGQVGAVLIRRGKLDGGRV